MYLLPCAQPSTKKHTWALPMRTGSDGDGVAQQVLSCDVSARIRPFARKSMPYSQDYGGEES